MAKGNHVGPNVGCVASLSLEVGWLITAGGSRAARRLSIGDGLLRLLGGLFGRPAVGAYGVSAVARGRRFIFLLRSCPWIDGGPRAPR
jgi:hypothetical protein